MAGGGWSRNRRTCSCYGFVDALFGIADPLTFDEDSLHLGISIEVKQNSDLENENRE